MVQKMRRTQQRTISANRNDQINFRQVLTIQFDAIDATKVDIVMAQHIEQIRDTLFVLQKALFETVPTQCFGGLAS